MKFLAIHQKKKKKNLLFISPTNAAMHYNIHTYIHTHIYNITILDVVNVDMDLFFRQKIMSEAENYYQLTFVGTNLNHCVSGFCEQLETSLAESSKHKHSLVTTVELEEFLSKHRYFPFPSSSRDAICSFELEIISQELALLEEQSLETTASLPSPTALRHPPAAGAVVFDDVVPCTRMEVPLLPL